MSDFATLSTIPTGLDDDASHFHVRVGVGPHSIEAHVDLAGLWAMLGPVVMAEVKPMLPGIEQQLLGKITSPGISKVATLIVNGVNATLGVDPVPTGGPAPVA